MTRMKIMNDLTIVMYHYVRDIQNSKYPKIKGLETKGFVRQLDYLNNNFNIIKAEDLIDCVKKRMNLPERSCLLTFDDGYKDHISKVLPELSKRNIQGSFFLPAKCVLEREILDVNKIHFILACANNYEKLSNDLDSLCIDYGVSTKQLALFKTNFAIPFRYDTAEVMYVKNLLQHGLEKKTRSAVVSILFKIYVTKYEIDFAEELYLSYADAKTLLNHGMYVGSHGYSHLWLEKETPESQLLEIDASLKFLKDIGSRTEDWIMCYPYGSYNNDTLDILKDRKCAVGLTSKVGMATVSKGYGLELSRYDTNDFPQ
jgi:peptidoglycan/xylan/chitin deacetylase (PgdA/CDA1 family)